jgi:hypothetical protein
MPHPPPSDNRAEMAAALLRLLDAPHPAGAVDAAVEWVEAAAYQTWHEAEGKPPRERLLLVLQAVAEELNWMAMEMASDRTAEG